MIRKDKKEEARRKIERVFHSQCDTKDTSWNKTKTDENSKHIVVEGDYYVTMSCNDTWEASETKEKGSVPIEELHDR